MQWDILFIGGGMACQGALRARKLGLKTAIVEREQLGGSCLHWGCVPSKTLLKSAEIFKLIAAAPTYGLRPARPVLDFDDVQTRRKDLQLALFEDLEKQLMAAGVEILRGEGSLLEPGLVRVRREGKDTQHSASSIVLATGSRPRRLPGVQPDGIHILTSDDTLTLPEVPQSICILGAGAVGCEFASFYAALGTHVTLLEEQGTLLPRLDRDLGGELASRFHAQKIATHVAVQLSSVKRLADGMEVQFLAKGQLHTIVAEKILLAVGRVPNSEKLGLEKLGITVDLEGFVEVDDNLQTKIPNVYAIGDLAGDPMLAHVAALEAISVAERSAGKAVAAVPYDSIPQLIESFPQIASVGLSEEEARLRFGAAPRVQQFDFEGNARAMLEGDAGGLLKLVFAPEGSLVGAHLAGHHVGDLVTVFTLAIRSRLTAAALRNLGHPQLSRLDVLSTLSD